MKKQGLACVFLLSIVLAWACAPTVWAADYPTKPVTLMVGFGPGGPSDVVARAVAAAAAPFLGQPLVVVNKPGATAMLMMGSLTTSRPDGYTIAVAPASLGSIPYFTKIDFDLIKDFTYLTALGMPTESMTVRAEAPWKSLKELLDYARQHPNEIKVGEAGIGTSPGIIGESLAKHAGVQWTMIPFKSNGEINAALLGGHIQVGVHSGEELPLVRGGKLRLLANFTTERLKEFPEVPTLRELGYDLVSLSLIAIMGPKDMPQPVVQKLVDAFAKAKKTPAWQETLKNLTLVPVDATGKDLEDLMKANFKKIDAALKK